MGWSLIESNAFGSVIPWNPFVRLFSLLPSFLPSSLLEIFRKRKIASVDLFLFLLDFPGGSAGKESACNAEDPSLIPGLGRSIGEGKVYPLQYSGVENSTDCIVHGVTKSWTRTERLSLHLLRYIHLLCSSFIYQLTFNHRFPLNSENIFCVFDTVIFKKLRVQQGPDSKPEIISMPFTKQQNATALLSLEESESFPTRNSNSQTHTSSWLLERSTWIIRNIKLYVLKT